MFVLFASLTGCAFSPLISRSRPTILREAHVYFADTTLTRDVTVDRKNYKLSFDEMTVAYDPVLQEIIDRYAARQVANQLQFYIFVGNWRGTLEITRIGFTPKGEEPPEI